MYSRDQATTRAITAAATAVTFDQRVPRARKYTANPNATAKDTWPLGKLLEPVSGARGSNSRAGLGRWRATRSLKNSLATQPDDATRPKATALARPPRNTQMYSAAAPISARPATGPNTTFSAIATAVRTAAWCWLRF